jgi:hypothetical protein
MMKVLICGLSSQTVIRSIDRITTCGELKRQLGVSRLMSCGQMLKDDHTFFDNDVIHVLGKLRGGMEVLSFVVLSCLVLSCLVLSCAVLSCVVFFGPWCLDLGLQSWVLVS